MRLSLFLPLLLALSAILLSACAGGPGRGDLVGKGKTSLRGAESPKLPWCICGKQTKKDNSIRLAYRGQEWRFCCKTCQDTFEANPGDYWF